MNMKPGRHRTKLISLDEGNPNPDCYENLAPIYEDIYGEIDAWETVCQWRGLLEHKKLLPNIPQGLKLLDVGCGTGLHLLAWKGMGFEVAGLDSSAAMLNIARKNLDAAGYDSPLYHVDIRDERNLPDAHGFNFAVSHLNFLNLFPRGERVHLFRSVAQVVRPGGFWIADFSEPRSPPSACEEEITAGNLTLKCRSYFLQDQNCLEQVWEGKNIECRERYWFGHAIEAQSIMAQSGWKLNQRLAWSPNVTGREWGDPSGTECNLVDIYERMENKQS